MTADTVAPECDQEIQVKLTDEDRRRLVDEAIERADRIVESEIEMAHLFISSGKVEIARRRLEAIIEKYPESLAVGEARRVVEELVSARG